jgi:hypothetical protein
MKWLEKIRDIIRAGHPKEGNRRARVTSQGESLLSKGQRLKLAEVFTNEIFEKLLYWQVVVGLRMFKTVIRYHQLKN